VTVVKICHGVALKERAASISGLSVARNPASVVTTTGNTATSSTRTNFEAKPRPSQATNNGASAMIGTELSALSAGPPMSDSSRLDASARPIAMPMITETINDVTTATTV